MKKLILVCQIAIAVALMLSSCIVYGTGKSFGYVTTVEEGMLWDHVWFRADNASSNTDCYMIKENDLVLRSRLEEASANGTRIEIQFKRHLLSCHGGLSDEIVDLRVIDTK
jgi:hypothetical protein